MDLEQIVGGLQSTENICRDASLDSIQLGLGWKFFKKRERIEIVQDKSAPAIERLISSLDFHHQQAAAAADPIYPYLAQIIPSYQLKLPRLLCTP